MFFGKKAKKKGFGETHVSGWFETKDREKFPSD
jgi:hypothetical protein